jgi:L-ascorbate metabolism protein UlaG (beta-lactamase superfamily)
MLSAQIDVQYIGAATAILEIGGLRFLTDPAFDCKGDYPLGTYTLRKVQNPVATASQLGRIDYVLLSHDHHLDNLDHAGQQLLTAVKTVFTTTSGAQRLNSGGLRPGETATPSGIHAVGLENWETVEVPTPDGRVITIMGTPCRHGPVGGDRGPVTGFVLDFKGEQSGCASAVYITGDTVWYEGVEEVAKRCDNIGLILLFMGAARLKVIGPANITMTVEESLKAARLFDKAAITPLHFEGWEHFTEGYDEIVRQYTAAGLLDRLCWAPAFHAV